MEMDRQLTVQSPLPQPLSIKERGAEELTKALSVEERRAEE
jgi:hypothetical protein